VIYQQRNSMGQRYFECIRYENFRFPPHMHRHPELVYVESGELELEINGQKEIIPAGKWAMVPSNHIHGYHTEKASFAYVCVFSEDHIPAFMKEIRDKTPARAMFSMNRAAEEFAKETLLVPGGSPDFYMAKAALYAVAGEYGRQAGFSKEAPGNEALANRIIRYVSENFTEDISLETAARELGYEKHYLSRCFRRVVPMHFSRYVNLFRVDAATELLQHTDLSITEIAMKSGFRSLRNFNRVFKDITGTTPAGRQCRQPTADAGSTGGQLLSRNMHPTLRE